VHKVINGKTYDYYEDWRNGKNITTYIGKKEAFIKHLVNIYKKVGIFFDDNYWFDEYSQNPLTLETLKMVKSLYQVLRNNIPISEIETELFIRYVHTTTALEGCTLDLVETKNLLSDSELTPDNKPFQDSQAVLNYKAVKRYIDNYHGQVNEKFVFQLHRLIMNSLGDIVGEYRKTDKRGIPGVNHPTWSQIPVEMDKLLTWYHKKKEENLHPIELACRLHCRFEEIHPFHDGNGRVGRALLDYMLRSEGYATIFVPIVEKPDYITALRASNTKPGKKNNYVPIIDFTIGRMLDTFLYIFVKSGMAQTLKSEEFKQFASKLVPENIVSYFIKILENYQE
jgi:fido (protein-threonine AMPylation protein)